MNEDNMISSLLEEWKQGIENRLLLSFIDGAMPEGKDKNIVVRTLEAFNRHGVSSMTVLAVFAEVMDNGKKEDDDESFGEALGSLWD